MNEILKYLKLHGEILDTQVAEAIGLSIEETRIQLTGLAANQEVMICQSTRYVNGIV